MNEFHDLSLREKTDALSKAFDVVDWVDSKNLLSYLGIESLLEGVTRDGFEVSVHLTDGVIYEISLSDESNPSQDLTYAFNVIHNVSQFLAPPLPFTYQQFDKLSSKLADSLSDLGLVVDFKSYVQSVRYGSLNQGVLFDE